MKKLLLSAVLVCAGVAAMGCTGIVPLQALPGQITPDLKEGRASCSTFFGVSGDCGIMAAAKAGDIKEIVVVDQQVSMFSMETIVYGR